MGKGFAKAILTLSVTVQVYAACVLLDTTAAAAVRNALCACVLERGRVCIGGEAGLALVDLERAELTPRRAHAPVATIAYVPHEQLLGEPGGGPSHTSGLEAAAGRTNGALTNTQHRR